MDKKIFVIGVGGRTGTMLAQELEKAGDVRGVGLEKEIDTIKKKRVYIETKDGLKVFQGKAIKSFEFQNIVLPDIIFLTIKNPVGPVVKYYYQEIKLLKRCLNNNAIEKWPVLVLSQNGLSAVQAAKKALDEVLGKEAVKVPIVRMSLFNPVDGKIINDKICISYSLPVRLSFGVVFGSKEIEMGMENIFKKAGIEAEKISSKKIHNMEFSKLFLNLIGMASAVKGFSVKNGFQNSEIFKEEISALREYVKAVWASGGSFLNFFGAPVRLIAFIIYYFPSPVLIFFRKQLSKIVSKGRGDKPKDLDEIEYYNGEVIKLGEKIGLPTPVNQKILKRALR